MQVMWKSRVASASCAMKNISYSHALPVIKGLEWGFEWGSKGWKRGEDGLCPLSWGTYIPALSPGFLSFYFTVPSFLLLCRSLLHHDLASS